MSKKSRKQKIKPRKREDLRTLVYQFYNDEDESNPDCSHAYLVSIAASMAGIEYDLALDLVHEAMDEDPRWGKTYTGDQQA